MKHRNNLSANTDCYNALLCNNTTYATRTGDVVYHLIIVDLTFLLRITRVDVLYVTY